MESRINARRSRGFTLVELVVVCVLAAILFSIAVPSYMSHLRQARRTEGKTAVVDMAAREERYFTTTGSSYTGTAANLGYAALPYVTVNSYYSVAVCVLAPGAAAGGCAASPAIAGPGYVVTATPQNSQTGDTQCTSFIMDSAGYQNATGSQTAQYCWAN